MAKKMPGVLPGEPNPNKPRVIKGRKPSTSSGGSTSSMGKPKMPLPTEPGPGAKYKSLKRKFQTPGIQPGENEAIATIMKNRGVSRAEARAIGQRRTSKGLTTAGVSGPGGNPHAQDAPRRKNVKNPDPGFNKPGEPTNGPAPQPDTKPTPGATSSRTYKRPGKRPPVKGMK